MQRRDSGRGIGRAIDPQTRPSANCVENLHPPQWRNPDAGGALRPGGHRRRPGWDWPPRRRPRRPARKSRWSSATCSAAIASTSVASPRRRSSARARLYAEMRDARHYGAQPPGRHPRRFSCRDATHAPHSARASAAAIRRAMLSAGRRRRVFRRGAFQAADRLEVDGTTLRFKKAIDRHRRAARHAGDSRARRGRLPHQRDRVRPDRIAAAAAGDRRRSAGLRAGAGVLPLRRADVTSSQDLPLFLPKEERDAAQILSDAFARDGIEVRLNTEVAAVRSGRRRKHRRPRQRRLPTARWSSTRSSPAPAACPMSKDMDLEAAGVEYDPVTGIHVDDFLRTSQSRASMPPATSAWSTNSPIPPIASARIVVRNALSRRQQRLSALTIPWCTYTDPEIAHVGLYVRQAREQQHPGEDLHRFRCTTWIARCSTARRRASSRSTSRRGPTASSVRRSLPAMPGEMISEITLAMVAGIGLRTLARVIHAYPTQAGSDREAAAPGARPHRRQPVSHRVVRAAASHRIHQP